MIGNILSRMLKRARDGGDCDLPDTRRLSRGMTNHLACLLTIPLLVLSGCRTLSLLPHNHNCPHAYAPLHAGTLPYGRPYLQPGPLPPQVLAPAPPMPAAGPLPLAPGETLAPIAPPLAAQVPPPVPVEDVVVESPPTVVETLLALRREMTELKNNNSHLEEKLDTVQQEAEQRKLLHQQTNRLMHNVREDLTTVQDELNAWRSDLTILRSRVQDQRVEHQRTLVDVEKQLHEMISMYADE